MGNTAEEDIYVCAIRTADVRTAHLTQTGIDENTHVIIVTV